MNGLGEKHHCSHLERERERESSSQQLEKGSKGIALILIKLIYSLTIVLLFFFFVIERWGKETKPPKVFGFFFRIMRSLWIHPLVAST
ncbi:hypothetical protein CARUB_v10018324mg [Capsella rubella]|uniref:Uncharacterized protein n=1 Tax=Capsella rubella TaxID=81985 RepID=R0HHL1_9BRAS|nr:hypothetical protein CARUB_v10018324mg [Capsella rubella]